jgi:excisionase family DNA binding protein
MASSQRNKETAMTKSAFSVREAAEEIGICKTKIYQEMGDGRIRARKSGRRTIILANEIERYLNSLPPVPMQTDMGEPKGTLAE